MFTVGCSIPNPLYAYVLNIFVICKRILLITFSKGPELIFCIYLNAFKYFYHLWITLFTIIQLNGPKYWYIIPIITFRHTVEEFQVFLFNTNNSHSFALSNGSKYCNVSQTIYLNISHLYTQLNSHTVLFQTIQFNISHLFALSLNCQTSIWQIDRTLSGTTTSDQSGPGSNVNEGLLNIFQSSSFEASALDYLASYRGPTLGGVWGADGVFFSPSQPSWSDFSYLFKSKKLCNISHNLRICELYIMHIYGYVKRSHV